MSEWCSGEHDWRLVEEQDVFLTPLEALKRYGQTGVAGTRLTRKICRACGWIEEATVTLDRDGLPIEDF